MLQGGHVQTDLANKQCN